ncbi:MAG: low molecular weight protein-tyrosine-phosphatase [Phyllobacterium sp.]
MHERNSKAILFVCLGNICRSPLAEGVFRAVVEAQGRGGEFLIDSAGTNGYHTGEAPDRRSIAVGRQHGVDISGQRCRQLKADDFTRFDLILGMDRNNVKSIEARRPRNGAAKAMLFCDLALNEPLDIPDPYYGGAEDFEVVYRMIRAASEGLSKAL